MSQASEPPDPATHSLLGLELLRFACAVSVLVFHYQHFYFVGAQRIGYSVGEQPLHSVLKPIYEQGWLGVEAFWALSGFIFFWKYAKPVAEGRVATSRFVVLRFSRLYPLHLLTLLLVAALAAWYRSRQGVDYIYQYNDWNHFALQLFLASDWAGSKDWSFNGPIWSISIEVLVYALFFLLCRLKLIRWWHVLCVIGFACMLQGIANVGDHPIVLCILFFYIGALTHLVREVFLKQTRGVQLLTLATGATGAVVGGYLVAAGKLGSLLYLALLTPVLLLIFLDFVKPRSLRVIRFISLLGNTTYASYLLHFPLQLLVANVMWGRGVELPLHHPAFLLSYLLLTFCAAAISYRMIEMPLQSKLRQLLR